MDFDQFPGIQLIILEYVPFEYIRIVAKNLETKCGLAHLASKRQTFQSLDIPGLLAEETPKEFFKKVLMPPIVDRAILSEDILWGFISRLEIKSRFIHDDGLLDKVIRQALKCNLLKTGHLYVMMKLMEDFLIAGYEFDIFLMPDVLSLPKGSFIYNRCLKFCFGNEEVDKDFITSLVATHSIFITDEKKYEDNRLVSKTFKSLYERVFSGKKHLAYLHRKTFSEVRYMKRWEDYNPERLVVMEEVIKRNSRKRKDRA